MGSFGIGSAVMAHVDDVTLEQAAYRAYIKVRLDPQTRVKHYQDKLDGDVTFCGLSTGGMRTRPDLRGASTLCDDCDGVMAYVTDRVYR